MKTIMHGIAPKKKYQSNRMKKSKIIKNAFYIFSQIFFAVVFIGCICVFLVMFS